MRNFACHNWSIALLLGVGNAMRTQNPKVQRTAGANPRWYIRPYVDRLRPDGSMDLTKERVYLGSCAELTKRQAQTESTRAMARLNDRKQVIQAQIRFGEFLDEYTKNFILKKDNLAVSTQGRYLSFIKNYVRPAFGDLMMAEVTTRAIDNWLTAKANAKMAWASRASLRNLMCGLFTQAAKWGYWQEKNPAMDVYVGRQRAVREKRKLTDEQTRELLAALPEDVRLICMMSLFCTLRISEVLAAVRLVPCGIPIGGCIDLQRCSEFLAAHMSCLNAESRRPLSRRESPPEHVGVRCCDARLLPIRDPFPGLFLSVRSGRE
jgi:hypothetical protein